MNLAVANVVMNGMVAYINVFGLAILSGVVRDIECRLTVSEEWNMANCGGNLQFLEELFLCNCFTCCVRERYVFRFHAGECDSVLFVS